MRYGVCFGIDKPQRVEIVKNAGFDYVECGFSGLSKNDEYFEAYKEALKSNNIKCEAANSFLPSEMSVTGSDANFSELEEFITRGMQRGEQIGLKKVVFGSGKSRRIDEATDFAEGYGRLISFLREVASPIAAQHGVTIVIEPLRPTECNIINTLLEGVMLAQATGCSNVKCLADLFHMQFKNDTSNDIRLFKNQIYHAHISNPCLETGKRFFPCSGDEFDYKSFIDALSFAGCDTCSIEAGCSDFAADSVNAAKLLMSL